jgi:hypothetical protein
MRQLKLSKEQAGQLIQVTLGFDGRLIAVKKDAMNPQAQAFITQFKAKGAKVDEKKTHFVVDIFDKVEQNQVVKLGFITIDLEEDTNEQIEEKLCNFYIDMYSKAGFKIE